VAAATSGSIAPAILLTEKALKHLNKMRAERNEDLCLRIGVKQGGCSGMSYTMEFESRANASADDSVVEYDGFAIGNYLNRYALFIYFFPRVRVAPISINHSEKQGVYCSTE
jgi:hypothetical protein